MSTPNFFYCALGLKLHQSVKYVNPLSLMLSAYSSTFQKASYFRTILLSQVIHTLHIYVTAFEHTKENSKVSGLAAWSENCKWYSSLPLGAFVALFRESV